MISSPSNLTLSLDVCVFVYGCMSHCVCVHACMHMCVCACVCACMHAYVCVCHVISTEAHPVVSHTAQSPLQEGCIILFNSCIKIIIFNIHIASTFVQP